MVGRDKVALRPFPAMGAGTGLPMPETPPVRLIPAYFLPD